MFAGALALIALQTVVSSDAAANRTGGAFTAIASLARRALSPAVALVPDLRPAGGVGQTAPSTYTTGPTGPTTPATPSHGGSVIQV
jgi:hypothetical protein